MPLLRNDTVIPGTIYPGSPVLASYKTIVQPGDWHWYNPLMLVSVIWLVLVWVCVYDFIICVSSRLYHHKGVSLPCYSCTSTSHRNPPSLTPMTTHLSSISIILSFQKRGSIQYAIFWGCLFALSIISGRIIQVVGIHNLFLFIAAYSSLKASTTLSQGPWLELITCFLLLYQPWIPLCDLKLFNNLVLYLHNSSGFERYFCVHYFTSFCINVSFWCLCAHLDAIKLCPLLALWR